jgi:hypothetical protein
MLDADLFEMTMDVLEAADFSQYEISTSRGRAVNAGTTWLLARLGFPGARPECFFHRGLRSLEECQRYVNLC